MSKKKFLKIIGIILLIVIAIFLVHTIRNYIIITDLQNKIAKYSDSTNYYIKETTVSNGETLSEMNYYRKDNNQVVFTERIADNLKMSIYDNGEKIDTFIETLDSKTALLDCEELESVNIYNNLETDNKLQTFLGSITSKIISVNYNGQDCYVIKGFISSNSLTSEKTETYIDKNTGLCAKIIEEKTGLVTEREYEFNEVDDLVFEEPDINQYIIQNNQ